MHLLDMVLDFWGGSLEGFLQSQIGYHTD